MNGLQDGTPYSGRPVGNIPEFMPLDNKVSRPEIHSWEATNDGSSSSLSSIESSSSVSKFCCITDLIRFMMKEAENLIKGSVHKDDFFIVHDALVLML